MKIYLDICNQANRFLHLLKFLPKDIQLVDSIKKSDLIILLVNSKSSLRNIDEFAKNECKPIKNKIVERIRNDDVARSSYFSSGKPIILIERLDTATTWARELEKYPNIIGLFKNRTMRYGNTQNEETFGGRYHCAIIGKRIDESQCTPISNDKHPEKVDLALRFYPKFSTLLPISSSCLEKINPVLWDFYSSPLSVKMDFYMKTCLPTTHKARPIDVFCVHTIKDGILGAHRKKAIQIVREKNMTTRTEKCDEKTYQKDFVKSKICVACWGYGEWTHMDGYAMYSKVILIKPNTDFVKMKPDLYQSGKRYIPCAPDFSDLSQIIDDVVKNYKSYIPMLESNYNFIKKTTREKAGKQFWKKVKEVYELNKK